MRDTQELSEFSKLVAPWLPAYSHIIKNYLAARVDHSWRLCGGRIAFLSDVDPTVPDSFEIETRNLCAGIEVLPVESSDIQQLLKDLALAPFRLSAHGREFDLTRGADAGRISFYFDPVNLESSTGSSRSPGVRISYSENIPPHIPGDRVLDTEVQGAKVHFPDVAHLIARLGLYPDILRLHTMPHYDVVAHAPARVDALLEPNRARVRITASRALLPEHFAVAGTLRDGGKEQSFRLSEERLPWRTDPGNGQVAAFDVDGSFDQLSVAVVYMADVLSSSTVERGQVAAQQDRPLDLFLGRAHSIASAMKHDQMAREIMRLPSLIDEIPEDALRSAKDIVEGCCKTVVEAFGQPAASSTDFPKLVRDALAILNLTPADVTDRTQGVNDVKGVLTALGNVASNVGALRNHYGAGHGKAASFRGLEPRHARLAAMAAITFVVFVGDAFLSCDE